MFSVKLITLLICVCLNFITNHAEQVLVSGFQKPTILVNASYGPDPEQIMDIYLPARRNNSVTKVFVLIHGGGWTMGTKSDFDYAIPILHKAFPFNVIANIGYRLATAQSPGFPKQIQDIQLALQFLTNKSNDFNFQPEFALMGNSAGAHLALLYGYGFDTQKQVKVIVNTVGPVDFTHPSYARNSRYAYALYPLVGKYTQNSGIYEQVSPIHYATKDSPKTISFYGNSDPLIPKEQGGILEDKLDELGVYNKFYLYCAGHGNWNAIDRQHYVKKIIYFLKNYF